ncbi:MAG: hypothetical protein ACYTED_01960, partial [Planctomycetota bacterium]
MSCVRLAAALLALAAGALASGINTNAALSAGKGQLVSRTRVRFSQLEADMERFLVQETLLYGATHRLSIIGTFGYLWNEPGPDGFTDLALRGRYKFFFRDEKRATLSFAAILGGEIPLGEEPIGSPDGGLRAGLVSTWERAGWRLDSDVIYSWRPHANDFWRADVALTRNLAETEKALWMLVGELNYRRVGNGDVLFLAPGVVYELRGWKLELSVQIRVAEDAPGPTEEFAVAFSVVR